MIYSSLLKKIQQLHGDFGVAAVKTGLTVKYCNEDTCSVIIRARHGAHKLVTSALPFLNGVEGKSVISNVLYVGATLKQCFKHLLKHQQQSYEEFIYSLKTDKEKQLLNAVLLEDDDGMEIT